LRRADPVSEDHAKLIRLLAAEHRLPIPRFRIEIPASDVPATSRRFLGVWIDNRGPITEARNLMLIVASIDKDGKSVVHWVYGPPGPKSHNQGPAGSFRAVGRIDGNTLSHTNPDQTESFKHVLTEAGSIRYSFSNTKGQTASLELVPVWTLVDAEGPGKR
jgi:hypothetical protein